MTLFDRPLARATVSGFVLAAALLVALMVSPQVVLILFASVLMAILLYGGADWLTRRTGMMRGVALGLFSFAILLAVAALIVVAVPVLSEQSGQLWEQVRSALRALRTRMESFSWGVTLLQQISVESLATMSSGGAIAGQATTALTSTLGALGNFVIICVLGVFLAADPTIYRAGLVALIAPSGRARAETVLDELTRTLRSWMVAQFLAMAFIGMLTMTGLWLLGVPLAFVLGAIAALLTFIPNLGPILAAAPAILLGFANSPAQGAWVVALYIGVQIVEGNVATPLIQQRTIALPPALIILMQLLMADLYGILGLAIATPLIAVAITLVRLLYVEDYLERGRATDAAVRPPSAESP